MADDKPSAMKFALDRSLIDPNFEGYKLSLSPVAVKAAALPSPAADRKASPDSQFSLAHVRHFLTANGLVRNPWESEVVYAWLSDGLYRSGYDLRRRAVIPPQLCLPIDQALWAEEGVPPSVVWVSSSRALVSLGVASSPPQLLSTSREPWEALPLHWPDDSPPVGLRDALWDEDGGGLKVLGSFVGESKAEGQSWEGRLAVLHFDGEGKLSRRQDIAAGTLHYAAFCRHSAKVLLVSSCGVEVREDSEAGPEEPMAEAAAPPPPPKRYSWGQSGDEACAIFSLPAGTLSRDVSWRLSATEVRLRLGETSLLEGELGGLVEVDGGTWTLEASGRLEVTLPKARRGEMWTELVKGDAAGEYVPDPALVAQVAERLAAFTTENANEAPREVPAFNAQQLEACDKGAGEGLLYSAWSVEERRTVAEADLGGRQFLFHTLHGVTASGPAEFCLRHDVDGCVWRPEEDGRPRHVATFNALGYVQASKASLRWTVASPSRSWAALVDGRRHAFVYSQPAALDSTLTNRKTGKRVPSVAVQQLLSLEGSEAFLGAVGTEEQLFLLTSSTLHVALLKEQPHELPVDKQKGD